MLSTDQLENSCVENDLGTLVPINHLLDSHVPLQEKEKKRLTTYDLLLGSTLSADGGM